VKICTPEALFQKIFGGRTLTLQPDRSGTARTARPVHGTIPKIKIAMEFQNRIMLRGVVGRADVSTFGSNQVCNFSVITEYSSVDREGNSIIEPTWFNVSVWGGREGVPSLYDIIKGVWIEVTGRIRARKYTAQNGEERTTTEVIARTVKVLPREEDKMQAENYY